MRYCEAAGIICGSGNDSRFQKKPFYDIFVEGLVHLRTEVVCFDADGKVVDEAHAVNFIKIGYDESGKVISESFGVISPK